MNSPKKNNRRDLVNKLTQNPAAQKAAETLHQHGLTSSGGNEQPPEKKPFADRFVSNRAKPAGELAKDLADQGPQKNESIDSTIAKITDAEPRTDAALAKQISDAGQRGLDPARFSSQPANSRASIVAEYGSSPPQEDESKKQEATKSFVNDGVQEENPSQETGDMTPTTTPAQESEDYSGRARGRSLANDNRIPQSRRDIVRQYAPSPPQEGKERTPGMEPQQ